MVTKEKLAYINENLVFGDKKKIEEKTKVSYDTVDNILRGKSYGENGDAVINAAERLIKLRLAKIAREKYVYGKRT